MVEMKLFDSVKFVLTVALYSAILLAAAPVAGIMWAYKKASAALR